MTKFELKVDGALIGTYYRKDKVRFIAEYSEYLLEDFLQYHDINDSDFVFSIDNAILEATNRVELLKLELRTTRFNDTETAVKNWTLKGLNRFLFLLNNKKNELQSLFKDADLSESPVGNDYYEIRAGKIIVKQKKTAFCRLFRRVAVDNRIVDDIALHSKMLAKFRHEGKPLKSSVIKNNLEVHERNLHIKTIISKNFPELWRAING